MSDVTTITEQFQSVLFKRFLRLAILYLLSWWGLSFKERVPFMDELRKTCHGYFTWLSTYQIRRVAVELYPTTDKNWAPNMFKLFFDHLSRLQFLWRRRNVLFNVTVTHAQSRFPSWFDDESQQRSSIETYGAVLLLIFTPVTVNNYSLELFYPERFYSCSGFKSLNVI